MSMKKITLILVVLLVLPGIALAEMRVDLRFRAGNAAGVDKLEVFPDTFNGSGDTSRNIQFDAVLTPLATAPVSPLFSFGIFNRRHSGSVLDLTEPGSAPITVDYNVTGVNLGIGMSIRANDNLHFEAKFEFSGGEGEPDLSGPGWIFGSIESDSYGATSFLVGGYYTIMDPGVQLGLELGAQSFRGDFQIHDINFPEFVYDGTVRGSGGIVNFVVGYRF